MQDCFDTRAERECLSPNVDLNRIGCIAEAHALLGLPLANLGKVGDLSKDNQLIQRVHEYCKKQTFIGISSISAR